MAGGNGLGYALTKLCIAMARDAASLLLPEPFTITSAH